MAVVEQTDGKAPDDAQAKVLARAAAIPLRRVIMASLLAGDAPKCSTGIGREIHGDQFDNVRRNRVLYHLKALEKWGLAEFSHYEDPPGNGKPMRFYRASQTAREAWTDHRDLLAGLTSLELARLRERQAPTLPGQLRALAGDVNRAILLRLMELGEASASELAAERGVPLENVASQLRALSRLGLIELTDTDQRRGGVIKFYKPSLPEWAKLAVGGEVGEAEAAL